jgi:hypothetical protein
MCARMPLQLATEVGCGAHSQPWWQHGGRQGDVLCASEAVALQDENVAHIRLPYAWEMVGRRDRASMGGQSSEVVQYGGVLALWYRIFCFCFSVPANTSRDDTSFGGDAVSVALMVMLWTSAGSRALHTQASVRCVRVACVSNSAHRPRRPGFTTDRCRLTESCIYYSLYNTAK